MLIRYSLSVLLIYSLGIASASSATAVERPPLPEELFPELSSILEAAQANAPDLVEGSLLKQEADERLFQAKSEYYPNLSINSNIGQRNDYRDEGEDKEDLGVNYSANLKRPIYHWGAIESKIEQARIDNRIANLYYLNNLQKIERQLRQNYITLLLNQASLRNENNRRSNLQKEFEATRVNYQSGKVSELAFHTVELDLESSLLSIDHLEQQQTRIRESFRSAAGWNQPIKLEATIPELNISNLQAWHEEQYNKLNGSWVNGTYELGLTRNAILKQEEQLTIIQARQRPLVNFAASATQRQTNTAQQDNVDTLTLFAGINISWNIFDGMQTKHEKIEATLRKRRLENTLSTKTTQLRESASMQLDTLDYNIKNLALMERRFSIKKSSFTIKQDDSRNGRISSTDLETERAQLNEFEHSIMLARAKLLIEISDYIDLTSAIES